MPLALEPGRDPVSSIGLCRTAALPTDNTTNQDGHQQPSNNTQQFRYEAASPHLVPSRLVLFSLFLVLYPTLFAAPRAAHL